MLDLGFMEILLIGVVAILVLGPEKLPDALVSVAKFFRKVKTLIANTKDTIEQEVKISELKEEAEKYKKEFLSASEKLDELTKATTDPFQQEKQEFNKLKNSFNSESEQKITKTPEREKITFKKEKKETELSKMLNKTEESSKS
jgi:sec-independent protein translocase protein TatB